MKHQLLIPMTFYVFYIFFLALLNFRTRLHAVKSGQMSPQFFKSFSGTPSERVVIVGRHYDNQFQLPILFLIGGALAISLNQINFFTVVLAWLFVLSRGFHSWIHLGKNKLQKRVAAFAMGWVVTLILWAQQLLMAVMN